MAGSSSCKLRKIIVVVLLLTLVFMLIITNYYYEYSLEKGTSRIRFDYFTNANDIVNAWIVYRGSLTYYSSSLASCVQCVAEHRFLVRLSSASGLYWSIGFNIIRIGSTRWINITGIDSLTVIVIDYASGVIMVLGVGQCNLNVNAPQIRMSITGNVNRIRFEYRDSSGTLVGSCDLTYTVSNIRWIKLGFRTEGQILVSYSVESFYTPFTPPVTPVVSTSYLATYFSTYITTVTTAVSTVITEIITITEPIYTSITITYTITVYFNNTRVETSEDTAINILIPILCSIGLIYLMKPNTLVHLSKRLVRFRVFWLTYRTGKDS